MVENLFPIIFKNLTGTENIFQRNYFPIQNKYCLTDAYFVAVVGLILGLKILRPPVNLTQIQ
jgi:hypothetical protein